MIPNLRKIISQSHWLFNVKNNRNSYWAIWKQDSNELEGIKEISKFTSDERRCLVTVITVILLAFTFSQWWWMGQQQILSPLVIPLVGLTILLNVLSVLLKGQCCYFLMGYYTHAHANKYIHTHTPTHTQKTCIIYWEDGTKSYCSYVCRLIHHAVCNSWMYGSCFPYTRIMGKK
jgi:hypothetical protein